MLGKKIAAIAAILSILCTVSVSAFGIGVQFDGNMGYYGAGPGASVTFKVDEVPLVFAVNISGSSDSGLSVGGTADYWFFNKQISKDIPVNWFFGLGAYAGIVSSSNTSVFLGARLPIGVNMFLEKKFIEPYLQVAPQIGVVLGNNWRFPAWSVPVSLGVRFWFK